MTIYSKSATDYYNFLRTKQQSITEGLNGNLQPMSPSPAYNPANGESPAMPETTPNSAGC